jgi:transposase
MRVYIGIDWSEQKHDVTLLNHKGAILEHFWLAHTPDGLLKLEDARQQLGLPPQACLVALETAHHLLIDFLWDRGYEQVYVIPPSVIKGSRGRYGQSGARDDRRDSRLIADVLRTDRARLHPWRPDSLLTRQIRAKVSLINHLTRSQVRLANRLRALLLRYYPAALHVFSRLTTQIALQFLCDYPTPQAAARLTWSEFEAFAHQQSYPNPRKLPACFARLKQEPLEASPETVLVYQQEAPLLASHLLTMVQAKTQSLQEMQDLFQRHPDYRIFVSLPGAGRFLAPALLAKFGDDRDRFPSPAAVQAWRVPARSPTRAVNTRRSSSVAPAIMSSDRLSNNGRAVRYPSRFGPMPTGNRSDRALIQTTMPIAVWATV